MLQSRRRKYDVRESIRSSDARTAVVTLMCGEGDVSNYGEGDAKCDFGVSDVESMFSFPSTVMMVTITACYATGD